MANEKKTIEHGTDDLSIDLGPLKFRHSRRWLNFTALGAIAVSNATALKPFHRGPVDIAAAAEQTSFDFREVTGENILAMTELVGGTIEPGSIKYDEHGIITEIRASIPSAFEYDSDEIEEVLESLQATGVTPKKLLGDLAQTSVTTGSGQVQVIGLANWTIDWKRKTADSTTTDDAEYAGNTGSTKSWTVKAEYMFIDGDPSQNTYIVEALSNTDDGVQTWNFFPTVELGRTAFQGKAIIDGITWASGIGKVLGMNISLTGTGPLLVLAQTAPVVNADTVTGQSAQV